MPYQGNCNNIKCGGDHKYCKRGNEWTIQNGINKGPEVNGVATELSGPLGTLISQYEVKLEKTDTSGSGTPYTARPDTQNHQITVTAVPGSGGYKGFKHHKQDSSVIDINRITIHGQALKDIQDTDFANKNFVFVYYSTGDDNNTKPLLICLAVSDRTADSGNIWYRRKKEGDDYLWEKEESLFQSIIPGGTNGTTIDGNLKAKLQAISIPGDTGYPKPELVVKLDYAANGTGANDTIKYRTGDKQVTVERLTDSTNFKGYKHDLGTPETINKVKIHGNEITGITADLSSKKFVYVYYSETGDEKLQRPYLICLSPNGGTGSTNKWYKRILEGSSNKWTNAVVGDDKSYDSIPPGTISQLVTKLQGIKDAPELDNDTGYTLSGSNVIDASVTPTNTTAANGALYGIGNNQITVEKKDGDGSIVPDNYVRHKHSPVDPRKTPNFTLSSVKHNDQY